MSDVWAYADCGGSELLVLLALADFADDDGENIYPSMATLARKCRLSESQTRRIVQSLIKKGAIEVVEVGGWEHGRNRSNRYRIVVEALYERGSKMTPHISRPRDHGTRAGDSTVLAPVIDDPSSDPLYKPPVKEMRPPRAQFRKTYNPDDYDF